MRPARPSFVSSFVALSLFAACSSAPEGGDAFDEDEVRARYAGLAEGSDEACAVLRVANEASEADLDRAAGLDARAAAAIRALRDGADGKAGTDDDAWFPTLASLWGTAHVKTDAFRKLRAFAAARPEYACGVVDVQVLAFNDFHGNLKPPSGSSGKITTGPNAATDFKEAGGAEYFATHVKRLRAENPNTVVVTAGDVVGATPLLSALFHDEPTVESMNLLGLDVAGVGNHEFDEGPEELLRLQNGGCHPVDGCQDGDGFDGARFRYLAANVVRTSTGKTLLPAYAVRRFRGARVGFIGVTLEGTPLVTSPSGVEGLSFKAEADTINALVPELKRKGVKTVVALIHEGGAQTGLYDGCEGVSGPIFEISKRLDPAVKVVVAGHTNAAHVCNLDGRLVTSAASAGRLLTDIDLKIDERTGEVVTAVARNVIATRDVDKDAAQTALIAKYEAIAAPLANRLVGQATADLLKPATPAVESPLGHLIADAQLAATRGNGAVAAFMNPGGVRADIPFAPSPAGEAPGAITYGEAFTVQPFGNTLMTITVTGAELRTMLEQQWSMKDGVEKVNLLQVSEGFTYAYDPQKPIGARVDPASIMIGGVVVAPDASYRITCNAFLADGGDGFAVLKAGRDRKAGGLDLDALLAYFAARSPVAPPAGSRVTRR